MAVGKILSGARVVVKIALPGGGSPQTIGIFTRCSWQVNTPAEGAWILGRMSAAALEYTSYELVSISATGWRVIGQSAEQAAGMPKLQDMLDQGYLTFDIIDRQTDTLILHVENVRAVGYSGDFASKSLAEMPVSYLGIKAANESGEQTEGPGATDLP